MHQSYEVLESQDEQFQSQLSVDLRIWMKKKFLETMKDEPSPLNGTPFSGGSFVVYGGTLLTLATAEGKDFPYVGHKAGDIDLCIEPPADSFVIEHANGFEKLSQTIMRPFLTKVAKKSGFQVLEENGSAKSNNGSDMYLSKHFTSEEIKSIFGIKTQNYQIPRDGIDVLLEVEWGTRPRLSFLNPQKTPFLENGLTDVRIDDWRAWLALKAIRASKPPTSFEHSNDSHGFKPRDIVDIYNAIHAKPSIFSMENNHDDLDLLRVLCLAQCARYDKTGIKFNLTQYEPTDQNITAFRQALRHRISNADELSDQFIGNALSTYTQLVQSIFPEINKETGVVTLSNDERNFLTEIRGYRSEPYSIADPMVNVSYLERKWPDVFKNHPELRDRILSHPTLVTIGENINSKRIDI